MGEVYNIGGRNEWPNIYIVKTTIVQFAERINDQQINEGLIKQVEECLGCDWRYVIAPSIIKAGLGWSRDNI